MKQLAVPNTLTTDNFVYPTCTLLAWPAARQTNTPFAFTANGVDVTLHKNRERNRVGEIARDPLCVALLTLGSNYRDPSGRAGGAKREARHRAPGGHAPTLPAKAECHLPEATARRCLNWPVYRKEGIRISHQGRGADAGRRCRAVRLRPRGLRFDDLAYIISAAASLTIHCR